MLLAELFVPAFRGVFTGILRYLFYPVFKELFAQDLLIDSILFLVLAIVLFGSLHLSRRQENKVWSAVGVVSSIIGFFLVFKN